MRLQKLILPIFLIIISLVIFVPQVYASTFVGYPNPSNTCEILTPTCNGGTGDASTEALGEAVQAPLTGKLTSVSFQTGVNVPDQIVVLTFPIGTTPATFGGSYVCGQSPQSSQCKQDTPGNVYTVQDVEGLTGLSTQSYATVFLANPVSVTVNQWIFMAFTRSGGGAGWIGAISSGGSTAFIDTCVALPAHTPNSGQLATTNGCNIIRGGEPVGGSFTSSTVSVSSVTQCYGNCGTPPITLVNTNSTHTINFNQSITLVYEFQSNLNGFLNNVTTNVAKAYPSGIQVGLAWYAANCPVGTTPFSQQCTGFLQGQKINFVFTKGKDVLNAGNAFVVTNGEWIALAITSQFSGLDINDTNTTVPLFAQSGFVPTTINNVQSSNLCTCKMGLWAFITGNVVTVQTPFPSPSSACINSDLSCFLIASACGLTPSNCFIGGSIIFTAYFVFFFLIVILGVSYINREYGIQVHIPPSLFFLFFLIQLFVFAAIGLFPPYVTTVIFIVIGLGVAGYFGSAFFGRSSKTE